MRLVKLEQNYRSQGNILDAANALIRNNPSRLGKNLWTSDGKGDPVRAFAAGTDVDEAAFVVETVRALEGDGVSLSECAVLYRSNAQSRVLEHALFNAGMPYRVWGGQRFFERAEIKHALAYLRLLATAGDDGAFLRIVNFPPRGVGARSVETLQETARGRGTSLWQAACEGAIGGKSGGSLAAFVNSIEEMRRTTAGLPLPEVVAHVNAASGLVAHYMAEKDGQERAENLQELVTAAQSFVREADLAVDAPIAPLRPAVERRNTAQAAEAIAAGTAVDESAAADASAAIDDSGAVDALTAFLAHAALEAGDTQAEAGRPALQLMTVHSAKGLEFHTVFVTGLEEGLFPHENSLKEFDGIEEERRLMYVAITRAKRRLYLTLAQSRMLRGQVRYNIPSRFIDEIPRELVAWLSAFRRRFDAAESTRAHPLPARAEPGLAASSRSAAGAGALAAWRIGQSVRHAKFGIGIIIDAEGRDGDARVQVNFRETGVKWLALEYANLAPA